MRLRFVAALVLVLATGCGEAETEGGIDGSAGPDAADSGPAEGTAAETLDSLLPSETLIPRETAGPETSQEVGQDVGGDAPFRECAPGEGCFLDKCTQNSQCQSGWCVEHMGEGMCTMTCKEECPAGWSCKQLAESEPDVLFICVSDFSNLCKPCATGENCKGPGGTADICVDFGSEGSFCGAACGPDKDCPWGFACQEATSVDGILLAQCVPEAGVCPCTDKSVSQGLFTPCEVSNEHGTCAGKRVCTTDGLSPCDATVPAPETCNALDDNCDGDADEAIFEDGKYVDLCNDDNECTEDLCQGVAGCEHIALENAECKDGNPCTVADLCKAGSCVGTPVDCDDSNPCTTDICNEAGGCAFEENDAPCDDGNPCTVADQCQGKQCAGFKVECDCQEDKDCGELEDGDLCNGTLFCNQEKLPYLCALVPGSQIVCPKAAGPDAPCLEATCDPVTGKCSFAAANDGIACSDGNACTLNDECQGGICASGGQANCNDGNLCTDDTCNPKTGCGHSDNDEPCDDGDPCTTQDACSGGKCTGGPALPCDDFNPCTAEACKPGQGCTYAPAPGWCDDGNACTTDDVCSNGKCTPGPDVECNDDNPCTKDACSSDVGCYFTKTAGPCDDGNPCTLNDQCKAGFCSPGPLVSCSDGNPCTDDSCDAKGLCQHVPNQAACDDGNACTTSDHCAQGKCTYEGLADCDDSNYCTTDSCDPLQGCLHTLNSAPCDDGDTCTLNDKCALGKCVPGVQLNCDDGLVCTTDSCDHPQGCLHEFNTAPCNDADPCTHTDTCKLGVCTGGGQVTCNDGNTCTTDSCTPGLGCQFEANAIDCDDLNKCTMGDKCADKACVPGAPIPCNDANPCTDDGCDPKTGCVFLPNQALCDDKDACTAGDACLGGACQAGLPVACNDGNTCTTDACVPTSGCLYTPLPNGTDCGGGKVCQDGGCTECVNPHGSQTFNYSGSPQTFTVPKCVKSVTLEAWGAQGGESNGQDDGGLGGYVKGNLAVLPQETLWVYVGEKGHAQSSGGWNGGEHGSTYGGGGGGASDVRKDGQSLNHRVIVAGAGAGGQTGSPNHGDGGHGGGLNGEAGKAYCCSWQPGQGGTQNGGGAAGSSSGEASAQAGSFGQGGSTPNYHFSGGGAGWYGGGSAYGAGGGGGSSYYGGCTNGTTTCCQRAGHGLVKITW
jgi:hypothetical protein